MTVEVNKQAECFRFFGEKVKDRVKLIQQRPEKYEWESMNASEVSPGIVDSTELVFRDLFSPTYFDSEKGEVKPTFFDDVSNKGGSCDRITHTTLSDIKKRSEARHAEFNLGNPKTDKPRSSIGLAELSVADVRLHRTGEAQTLCVYDTALNENISHADIALVIEGKAAFRSARFHLFDKCKFSSYQDGVEIRKPVQ